MLPPERKDSARVVVIVSNDPADICFANILQDSHNVVGVVVEDQVPIPDRSPVLKKLARNLGNPGVLAEKVWENTYGRIYARFADFNDPARAANFGADGGELRSRPDVDYLLLEYGVSPNSRQVVAWIRGLNADVITTCGASILRHEVLVSAPGGALNLHGGLSQFYRGVRTTDWALYNRQPELIGTTIHRIAPGIDDGDIVFQSRPEIAMNDDPNSLYEKVVRLGIEMMQCALNDFSHSGLDTVPLASPGQLYTRAAFTPGVLRQVWRNCRRGLVRNYVVGDTPKEPHAAVALYNPFDRRTAI